MARESIGNAALPAWTELYSKAVAYRPDWEHDHCAICSATLMEKCAGVEDTLHEGFAITAKYEHGADYEWVCVDCFEASKDAMEWQDETPP